MHGVQLRFKLKVLVLQFFKCLFNTMSISRNIKRIHLYDALIYIPKLFSTEEISLILITSAVQGKRFKILCLL